MRTVNIDSLVIIVLNRVRDYPGIIRIGSYVDVFGVVREGMELVQAAAGVPTTNDADGDGSIPRVPGGPDRPLYEVHINSITIREYVSAPVEKTDEEGLSGLSLSVSALSIILTAIALSRKINS